MLRKRLIETGLLEQDLKFSRNNKVPILFWYGVGIPKADGTKT